MKFLTGIVLVFVLNNSFYTQQISSPRLTVVMNDSVFNSGLFDACHAATIVEVNPNKLIAAWFAGSYEGAEDVIIWTSTFTDNRWSAPQPAASGYDTAGNPVPCWNPVLFKTSNNSIILFYKAGPNPREWWGELKVSLNGGESWSTSQKLPDGFLGPVKNKPVQLDNGNLLCPSSVETADGIWSVHLEITNNDLTVWQKIGIEKDDSVGVIQPTIIQHPNGRLQMLCRSRQNYIYETWSDDNGQNWSKLCPTNVPNPNSGIDAVTQQDGTTLLVYNPLVQGKDWYYGRNVLNIAMSDDGINWKDVYQLESEVDGEFSYPAVIQASDKRIHVVYTALRRTIKHVILSPE